MHTNAGAGILQILLAGVATEAFRMKECFQHLACLPDYTFAALVAHDLLLWQPSVPHSWLEVAAETIVSADEAGSFLRDLIGSKLRRKEKREREKKEKENIEKERRNRNDEVRELPQEIF